MTGGGGSNKAAFAGLKKAASRMDIDLRSADDRDNPVARGGLALYPTNEPDTLPVGCFYVVRDEQFDYMRHPDAIKKHKGAQVWRVRKDGFNHPTLNTRLTKHSMEGDGIEAVDRIALLARTSVDKGACETRCVPYTFPIDSEWNMRLDFTIYFSEKYEPNGKPLLDKFGNVRSIFKVRHLVYTIGS